MKDEDARKIVEYVQLRARLVVLKCKLFWLRRMRACLGPRFRYVKVLALWIWDSAAVEIAYARMKWEMLFNPVMREMKDAYDAGEDAGYKNSAAPGTVPVPPKYHKYAHAYQMGYARAHKNIPPRP